MAHPRLIPELYPYYAQSPFTSVAEFPDVADCPTAARLIYYGLLPDPWEERRKVEEEFRRKYMEVAMDMKPMTAAKLRNILGLPEPKGDPGIFVPAPPEPAE